MIRFLGLIFFSILLCSCKESKKDRIVRLVNEWEGRTVGRCEICYLCGVNIGKNFQAVGEYENDYINLINRCFWLNLANTNKFIKIKMR